MYMDLNLRSNQNLVSNRQTVFTPFDIFTIYYMAHQEGNISTPNWGKVFSGVDDTLYTFMRHLCDFGKLFIPL